MTIHNPRRVVLDCDTANEIDDQFAVAYALGSPAVEVLGVVSVHNTLVDGAGSVDRYAEEARRVATLCGGRDLPCPRGAAEPMERPDLPVVSEGLAFLVEQAREAPVTVLATGPATDVASLGLVSPDLVDRVEVVWAGGFPDEATWEREKFGELNARADIQAWRALTASDLPLRMLPGWPGVVEVAVEPRDTIDRLRSSSRPACAYLADLLERWVDDHDDAHDMDSGGASRKTKVLWDIVNVAAVAVPGTVRWEQRPLPSVDPAGSLDWDDPQRTVPLGLEVDAGRVLDDLWRCLAELPDDPTVTGDPIS